MPYLNDHATKFDSLIADVNEILDPSSGLDSSGVNPVDIQSLMSSYMSDPVEWDAYALEDASKTYTRNLIDEGNGKSNLVRLLVVRIYEQRRLMRRTLVDSCLDAGERMFGS